MSNDRLPGRLVTLLCIYCLGRAVAGIGFLGRGVAGFVFWSGPCSGSFLGRGGPGLFFGRGGPVGFMGRGVRWCSHLDNDR
ncbi:unnamed protein product [Linum tenue]|uniref:Uncharacterized protein n=1 Tax=Linum tenue TaxID=586396 RepID=A0AAV0RE01_9ROSI|nr:unnamed protein product [Linum tenue]